MLRILYIIDSLDDSGAANQLRVLARNLSQEGLEVEIAVLDPGKSRRPVEQHGEDSNQIASSVPITWLGRRWTIDPLALLQLALLIRRFQPDVVHSWSWEAAVYVSVVLTRLPHRWRNRIRAWGLGRARPKLAIGLYRIHLWTPRWQWLVAQRLARFADRLVTSSPNVRDWCVARGLPANRFTVIPAGVPAARPSDLSREQLLRELRLPADAKLIGVVGRLAPENRAKDLIWAADLLRVLHDNLRVLVIGDGTLRPQLEEYARLASDLDHIRFLGERRDLWRIMPHLDVLWNGAENVGTSAAILDAMAAGVPVVACDTPTNRELMVDGETGYLIPLGTRAGRAARARCTDRIFTDAGLANRLSQAAKQRATKQFGETHCLSKYWELYSEISK